LVDKRKGVERKSGMGNTMQFEYSHTPFGYRKEDSPKEVWEILCYLDIPIPLLEKIPCYMNIPIHLFKQFNAI